MPKPLGVPDGRGGRRVGGGARHLDRGTSRLQEPRRGRPGSLTSVSQSADTFHVRGEAGGSGAAWPLMPGWGGDKLHREMCPSKRGPQGQGPEGRDGGWTQDPPWGPKVPVCYVCPQQGQHWAAPTRLFCPLCGMSTSSLLSLANTVGGGGRRSPRLALVAGSRDLGRGGLAGWPTPSIPPICWCWAQVPGQACLVCG